MDVSIRWLQWAGHVFQENTWAIQQELNGPQWSDVMQIPNQKHCIKESQGFHH